jgi:hypothetical protein
MLFLEQARRRPSVWGGVASAHTSVAAYGKRVCSVAWNPRWHSEQNHGKLEHQTDLADVDRPSDFIRLAHFAIDQSCPKSTGTEFVGPHNACKAEADVAIAARILTNSISLPAQHSFFAV